MAALVLVGCGKTTARRHDGGAPAAARIDAAAPVPAVAAVDAAVASTPAVDSTTGASPAWKPGAPVVVGETVDGAALRKANRARLAADQGPVTVLTGGGALELGQRLCEAVVPHRPPETPVLLKPNISGFDWFKDPRKHNGDNGVAGRTTDPEFVRGVIRCLRARGHTKITVADGFGGETADWDRLAKVSGYAAMCAEEHVPLVALDDDGVYDVQGTQPGKPLGVSGMEKTTVPTLLIPKIVAEHLDHGLFLSLPKIKDHRFAGFSVGIKSLQGVAMYSDASPAYRQKWRTHREVSPIVAQLKKGVTPDRAVYVAALEKFAARMTDILEIEAPHAVLAEGAPAMSGDGFEVLYPSKEMVAIGGTNAILVDREAAAFLGLWDSDGLARELGGHRTSPLLEVAAARFGVDLEEPKVVGDGAGLLAARRPARYVAMIGFTLDETAGGAGTPPAAGPATGTGTELHAFHITDADAPAIDGKADAIWDRAAPLTFATDYLGAATTSSTTVRALWTGKALYLRWDLGGAGLHTDTSRPIAAERENLYQEDCVELFLAPDPAKPRRYAEVELGPYGHFFDLLVDRSGARAAWTSEPTWSAGLTIGTSRDAAAHTATIEVAVAGPEVAAALAAGARLPVGLDRMEGVAPRRYLQAFPAHTKKPNFHDPAGFGTLVLDP
ncbi:MAG TPA: DUF362 domain-containing protein [Kofleriaceae bacterium]|nr:DUF362 domain-containing protein [Kofleriaceae bacterium]